MSTTAGVVRPHRAVHDPGLVAELVADLDHDPAGGPGHRADRETGEQEHHRRADDQAEQHVGLRRRSRSEVAQVSRRAATAASTSALRRCRERAEQRGRRQHGRRDRDALGDRLGGVADRVEGGEHLGALRADLAGHLGDALRVVGDRAEGVHRDDDADRGEQAGARERDREQRQHDRRRGRAGRRRRRPHRSAPRSRPPTPGRCEMPPRMTVAAPVSDARPMSCTGRRLDLGEVAGEHLDRAGQHQTDEHGEERHHPRVAVDARDVAADARRASLANDDGRKTNDSDRDQDGADDAEMKKPRLIAVRPLRSPSRGA